MQQTAHAPLFLLFCRSTGMVCNKNAADVLKTFEQTAETEGFLSSSAAEQLRNNCEAYCHGNKDCDACSVYCNSALQCVWNAVPFCGGTTPHTYDLKTLGDVSHKRIIGDTYVFTRGFAMRVHLLLGAFGYSGT